MKIKKVISLVLSGILALSLVACGNEKKEEPKREETKKEETKKDDKKSDIIKKDKDSLFALGKEQTQKIKVIVEKYGVKTKDSGDAKGDVNMTISRDENNASSPNSKGYTITTVSDVKINDGQENDYDVRYFSVLDDGKSEGRYQYQVNVKTLGDGTFKIENTKMMKELIQVIDKDYDFGDFDKWVNDFLDRVKEGKAVSKGRNHGAFHENIKGEINDKNGKKELFLMYTVTLNSK